MSADAYTPTEAEVREAVAEWMWSRRMWREEVSRADGAELDRFLAALSTPPADDVREAIAKAVFAADEPTLDYERKWPSETDEVYTGGDAWRYYLGIADRLIAAGIPAAAALASAFDVIPSGSVDAAEPTDAQAAREVHP